MTLRFRGTRTVALVTLLLGCSASTSSERADDAYTPSDGVTPGLGHEPGAKGPTDSEGAPLPTPSVSGAGSSAAGASSSMGAAPPDSSETGAPRDPNTVPAPGVLTVGTWDDNRNFDFFQAYRQTVRIVDFPGLLPISDEEHLAANRRFAQTAGPKSTLDISLVIDTTGSMGDEIRYLQREFVALSDSIEALYPNAEQRWSLVLYRDTADSYVVQWYDFRTDTVEFQSKLDTANADGGGDFPEAPDQALARAAQLGWRSDDSTARLAFWVADAPYHAEKADGMADAIRALQQANVHVYPVASSGIDEFTEVSMRATAQLTGGRYLFLTNDSGVGNSHKEPTTPCYFVTKLDKAITRMVDIELSGSYHEPAAADVLRTGGDPKSGYCTLASGAVVEPY